MAVYRCLAFGDKPWPRSHELGKSGTDAGFHDRMCDAIAAFDAGQKTQYIHEKYNVSRQLLRYWLRRCSQLDEFGQPYQWRAFKRYSQLEKSRQDDPAKLELGRSAPGVLGALFAEYPAIKKDMVGVFLNNQDPAGEKRQGQPLTSATRYQIFLESCAKHGVKRGTWPCIAEADGDNKGVIGKVALTRWGEKLKKREQQRKAYATEIAKQPKNWIRRTAPSLSFFKDAETDGHYVDIRIRLALPSPRGSGAVVYKLVTRLWLICIIERKSTAVLGYAISYGEEYSASDVIRSIQNSLLPWTPRDLEVTGISYKPGDCLPSIYHELSYMCVDNLHLDNALSHLAHVLAGYVENTINAVPIFGPRDAPDARPHIEGFHNVLEEAGIHPLDGTTGSSPTDPRRDEAEEPTYFLTAELLEDLIDLLVARYNNTRLSGTSHTRVELLRTAVQQQVTLFRQIPLARREDIHKYQYFEEATVGGSATEPVLWWHGARYYGPGLLSEPNLVGRTVLIKASADIRQIDAFLIEGGKQLGTLHVEKRWRGGAHSLTTRLQINRLDSSTKSFIDSAADIVLAFRRHVEALAIAEKKWVRTLKRLQQEQPDTPPAVLQTGKQDNPNGDPDIPQSPSATETEKASTIPVANDEFERLLSRLGTTYR